MNSGAWYRGMEWKGTLWSNPCKTHDQGVMEGYLFVVDYYWQGCQMNETLPNYNDNQATTTPFQRIVTSTGYSNNVCLFHDDDHIESVSC